jgi:solute carrier family 25 S-adenosylmethionine transporter 26
MHSVTPHFASRENFVAERRANSTLSNVVAKQLKDIKNVVGSTVAESFSEPLSYLQTMAAGALSRGIAQTLLHPAYTYKTILQLKEADLATIKRSLTIGRLFRGIDAQFLLAIPHGAFHFFVIDQVKQTLRRYLNPRWQFLSDFSSSAVSTVICSIISTPQMVLTDRLMAGVYPNLGVAVNSIFRLDGILGFYRGWWPALVQKIPSYGLTWMFFQQLKRSYEHWTHSSPNHESNFVLGALAAAASVSVMIPFDTIKTRIVIQTTGEAGNIGRAAYTGVTDCFLRILREEGVGVFYRSLPPRLLAVVPMIAIQFGIYESMKMQFQNYNSRKRKESLQDCKAIGKTLRH